MSRKRKGKIRKQGLSMTTILVLMVVCTVAIGLACCASLFIARYTSATVQSAKTSSNQAVVQAANIVGNYTRDMSGVMDQLIDSLSSTENQDDFFASFLKIRQDVIAVTSYDSKGNLLECWALGHKVKPHILENLSFDSDLAASGIDSYISSPHVESIFEGYYPWVVTMAEKLDNAGEVRWLAVDLTFSNISSYISNVGIGQHGYCFLMDTSGNIVYHPQQQLIYSGLKTEDTSALIALADGSYADDNIIYSIQTVEGSHWRVVGVSYVDELVTQNVSSMVKISLFMVLAVLLVTAGCSLIVSGFLSHPLQRLSASMESFEKDANHYTYQPIHGSREVRELSNSFDHMVGKIQHLMAQVRQEEIDLRKTELKALQAQINPHFLYNTLDSIAWMCEEGRNIDAVQMVHALAKLFRISISKDRQLIPISKEIEHAESYLQIQKYRYKNRFAYSFDLDPACLNYLCNKITLQPIIENAIYHGLEMLVEEGRIAVRVQQDEGDIVFTVTDNGVGMSQEQADSLLNREPGDRTGIGIKNVNDRLRIYFGEKYGLRITSELDVGTSVEIRMPKIREGEYDEK